MPSNASNRRILHTRYKIFNDSVHGHIELHPLSVKIIDTVEFQRLRDLKQLGTTYSVYPSASHNRFEHSLGVAHLASKFIHHLARVQPELHITEEEKICIEIAGLVHDLGHGVLSHVFDGSFIPALKPDCQWQHEWASLRMFDHLIENNNLRPVFMEYGIDDEKINFIKEVVLGDTEEAPPEFVWKGMPPEKMYLYEIVANKVSGIDVDKWDYFQRDCKQLNMTVAFDASRLMKFARVLAKDDGRTTIAYAFKEGWNVYQLFASRYSLHKRAYQHRVSRIIEKMYLEAMILADKHIKLRSKDGNVITMSESINDMSAYATLSDWILRYILSSPDENLAPARAMLERVLKRDLYPFVGEALIPVPPNPTSPGGPTNTAELQETGVNVLNVCRHNKLLHGKRHVVTNDDDIILCSQLPTDESSMITETNDSPVRGFRLSQLSTRHLGGSDLSEFLESGNPERSSQVKFLDDSTDNPIVILDESINNLSDRNVVLNDANSGHSDRDVCDKPECKASKSTTTYKKWGKKEVNDIVHGILEASNSLTQRELTRARNQLLLDSEKAQYFRKQGGSDVPGSLSDKDNAPSNFGSSQRQVGQKSLRQGTLNFRSSQQTHSSLPADYIYSTPVPDTNATLEQWEKLSENDFIVDLITINCGKGNKDPVEFVTFYEIDSHDNIVEKKLIRSQISVFMPYAYEEQYVRVYCKDPRKYHIVYSAFEKLWAKKKETKALMNTPARNF